MTRSKSRKKSSHARSRAHRRQDGGVSRHNSLPTSDDLHDDHPAQGTNSPTTSDDSLADDLRRDDGVERLGRVRNDAGLPSDIATGPNADPIGPVSSRLRPRGSMVATESEGAVAAEGVGGGSGLQTMEVPMPAEASDGGDRAGDEAGD